MNVLMYKVGQPPEVIEVEYALHAMQELIDGNLEMLGIGEGFILVADAEGVLKNKPVNRVIRLSGFNTTIQGDFFICKAEGEHFVSITDQEAIYAATHFIYAPYKN